MAEQRHGRQSRKGSADVENREQEAESKVGMARVSSSRIYFLSKATPPNSATPGDK